MKGQVARLEALKELYLKNTALLEQSMQLQNQQIGLLTLRLEEQSGRIEGLIEEKNKYKYRSNWSLFGMKVSGFTAALLTLGVGFAIGR